MKERPVWISVCIILVFALGLTLRNGQQARLRAEQAEQHTYGVFQKQEEYKQQIRQLQTALQLAQSAAAKREPVGPPPDNSENEPAGFSTTNLPLPASRLIADLRKHRDLIPYAGMLGGTMDFYAPARIRILNERWLLAPFEDGHTSGQLLLRYTVLDDGQISWKRLDAFRD